MNMLSRLILVPCLLSALPGQADETPMAHRPMKASPGDFREYGAPVMGVPCLRWEFTGLTEAGEALNTCGDKTMVLSTDFDLNPTRIHDANGRPLVEFKPFYPQLSFPLTVGKEWSGEYSGFSADDNARWQAKATCRAEAYEKLTVAAGEFDTFRIACVDHWRAGPQLSGEVRSTRWYAPKIFSIIKVVHDLAKWNTELVKAAVR